MELKINFEKLDGIMQAFYLLTGIKIIIFDEKRNVIRSYPENDCAFCKKIKSYSHTSKKCTKNDIDIFASCKKDGQLKLYTCHAGLVEGCAPLSQGGKILGYIMFGQISDLPSRDALLQNITNVCSENNLDEKLFHKLSKSIKLKSYDDIMASAKIFEACISYIILNEMLTPELDKTMQKCEEYIDSHIDSVNVEALCKYMNLSRTVLYDIFRKKTSLGVATFIRNKRLQKAKELLPVNELSISEIASKCGFDDYNYFSRVFKQKFGQSARSYR